MKIGVQKAKRLITKGATLVDIRSPVEFAKGTLPNAVNVPIRNISQLMRLNKKVPVIFFSSEDNDPQLDTALNYAYQMQLDAYSIGALNNLDENEKSS